VRVGVVKWSSDNTVKDITVGTSHHGIKAKNSHHNTLKTSASRIKVLAEDKIIPSITRNTPQKQ
jgi:hypothetical protein